MEWPGLNRPNRKTLVAKRNFLVEASENMQVHQWVTGHCYPENPNGTYTVRYDEELKAWFNFVDSGAASTIS